MPRSGCSALHGVNPNFKKKMEFANPLVILNKGNRDLDFFYNNELNGERKFPKTQVIHILPDLFSSRGSLRTQSNI